MPNRYLLLFIGIFFTLSLLAQTSDNEQNEIELESIRSKIKDVESLIKDAKNEIDLMAKELRKNEVETANKLTQVHGTQLKIKQKHHELEQLRFEREEMKQSLK